MTDLFDQQSHRRYDPLADEWILVSPHRTARPWLGADDRAEPAPRLAHDPQCHLCPGAMRANGVRNPDYVGPYVFANDFPALQPDANGPALTGDPMFQARPALGEARVLCFSPHHTHTLADLSLDAVGAVVQCWVDQSVDLGARYQWVQIFENKGAMMGCSNPHPHGQIWATDALPHIAATECRTQRAWTKTHGTTMLLDLATREAGGPRSVVETGGWVAIVPYWAKWPFETMVLPRYPAQRLSELDIAMQGDLAVMISQLTQLYDGLFKVSFPYSMGWHGAPYDGADHPEWQVHAHVYPPLLRSASIRKFMVGYEMLAEAQRDMTPEQAASRLRALA